MVTTLGTRTRLILQKMAPDQGSRTRSRYTDEGMRKLVTASLTFVSATARVTAANGTFTNTFAVGDPVAVFNTNLNNGFFTVVTLDAGNAAFLGLFPPPKDEGPITCTIRTT